MLGGEVLCNIPDGLVWVKLWLVTPVPPEPFAALTREDLCLVATAAVTMDTGAAGTRVCEKLQANSRSSEKQRKHKQNKQINKPNKNNKRAQFLRTVKTVENCRRRSLFFNF